MATFLKYIFLSTRIWLNHSLNVVINLQQVIKFLSFKYKDCEDETHRGPWLWNKVPGQLPIPNSGPGDITAIAAYLCSVLCT